MTVLTDDELHRLGSMTIARCEVVDDGAALRFSYPMGRRYRVPLAYLLTWFGGAPHGRRPVAADTAGAGDPGRVHHVEQDGDGACVYVVLGDGSYYCVGWDLVLMACEPDYVHFGGFTDESRASSRDWLERAGPFRV